MKNKLNVEAGKKGAEQRWAKRYEALVILSGIYGKEQQNEFIKWPTKYLLKLVEYINTVKKI